MKMKIASKFRNANCLFCITANSLANVCISRASDTMKKLLI